jgi:hypothetical protein
MGGRALRVFAPLASRVGHEAVDPESNLQAEVDPVSRHAQAHVVSHPIRPNPDGRVVSSVRLWSRAERCDGNNHDPVIAPVAESFSDDHA